MINIPNNDSHIVQKDNLIVELTQQMLAHNLININLNGEGPCAESLGLYNLLDTLADRFNYSKDKITITTCNLVEQHNDYYINVLPQMMYLKSARKFASTNALLDKEFNNELKHFGNFIGHGNIHRLHMASYLYSSHKAQTLQSYHYNRHSEYHRMFVGLEDMLFNQYSFDEIISSVNFLKQTPIVQDSVDQSPILNPTTLNITKLYHNFFAEIVNLTYFSGNTFYIDEKIWRPMIMKTPFLIQGPQNYIINLRKLGFKTFDVWWDEGYSEDPGRLQNNGIISVVQQLATYSVNQLESMYADMRIVLEHNYNRLFEISEQEFKLCKN